MTLHDSCHSNVGWTVSKTTEELVSDGDLTSSDFDLDLGSFTNIRSTDECHNETNWKTYADLTEQQACNSKDVNNNSCGKSLMLSSSSFHPSSCDEQNVKMREIGHISPLHCGTFDRNSQGHALSGSAVSEVLARQDMTSPHLVTSNSEWMNLVASMNLTQLYDGTSTPSFQYILGAATTPATKMNEESLTYLNQGQSYEIKLKRLGDGPGASDTEQYLKSVIRVVFHERRLQYMEREQLETWRRTRPGERILDIDIPLSYGLLDVKIDPQQLSSLEFIWDARREGGIFVKINAISTEFTARRHGGEKGVPFRVQVETYSLHGGDEPPRLLHCASCQVKVFKPKGADRKHKTDREKLEKRSDAEKEKYQPSFECTVMSEIPLDQVKGYLDQLFVYKPSSSNGPTVTEMTPTPPSTSAVIKNSLGLGHMGQFNSSSQLNTTSLACSSPCSSVNTITPALIGLPSTINQSTPASDPSNNVGRNVSGSASNSDISSRELVAGRLDYQSQASSTFEKQSRAPCISVTVSQGMSFINMSGSRDSLLSQTIRKPLLSPTPLNVPSFPHQMTPPLKLENSGQRPSVTRSSGCLMTDSSSSIGSSPMTSPAVLASDSSAQQVVQWLTDHRFSNFIQDFQNFSGSDLLRLTRDELIQICGLADGIRLDNALQAKKIRPKLTIYVYQETEYDRLSSRGVRSAGRHSSDSHWDMVSPVGSPSCSSPYPSSSHLSSCSSDPSLPTTNLLSSHISSSSGAYLERRRGSVQLPTPSSRLPVNFLSAKRRFNRTYDSSTEDDGTDGNSRKKQRLRPINMSQIDGYCAVYLETYSVCHLADKLAALFHIDVSQIDDMYYKGPSGINVLITDSVIQNLMDQARYAIEVIQLGDVNSGLCRLLLKYVD